MFGPMPFGSPVTIPVPTSFTKYVTLGVSNGTNGTPNTGWLEEYGLDSNILYYQDESVVYSNQDDKPGNTPIVMKYSPDNSYLAIGCYGTFNTTDQLSLGLLIYKVANGVFTRVPQSNIDALPSGDGFDTRGLAWNNDGTQLAVATNGTPFIVVYSRSGDTFTRNTAPATKPAVPTSASLQSIAWTPSGSHIVCSYFTAANGGLRFYSVSGTTLTSLTVPTAKYDSYGLSWSPDSTYLAVPLVTSSSSAYLRVYKRTSNALSLLTLPSAPNLSSYYSAWSPDGQFLAVTTDTNSAKLWIYSHSGDTFTRITSIDVLPVNSGGYGVGLAWSSDSSLLYVGDYDSGVTSFNGSLIVYSVSGTTFTKLTKQSSIPHGQDQYTTVTVTSIATLN